VIGLFVLALNYIDALRRAFLLANLAGHTAQTGVRIIAVVRQKRKVPVVFRQRNALLRILHRDQALLDEITSNEVPRRHRHSLEYSCANHIGVEKTARNYTAIAGSCWSSRSSARSNSVTTIVRRLESRNSTSYAFGANTS